MASWSNTTIAEPFRNLYYDYQPEAESVWNDTTNRIRQSAAQGMASEGLPAKGPAYQARVNTGVTNAGVARAKQEQAAQLAHTRTMSQLPTTPPITSSIMGPLAGAVGKELGAPIAQGLAGGATKLWNMGTEQLGNAYQALTQGGSTYSPTAYGYSGEMPAMEQGWEPAQNAFNNIDWSGYTSAAEEAAPAASDAVSNIDWNSLFSML